MNPQLKKFEQVYIKRRNAIEKRGVSMIKRALKEQYGQFLASCNNLSPSQWKEAVNAIKEAPIKRFFEQFYPISSPLAIMVRKNMIGQKSDEDQLYLSIFEQRMQQLVSGKDYASRIVTITNTTRDKINSVLQEVLTEGELNGYGIDKLRTNLVDEIGKNFRGNARARAKVIAQTEMISASNQASMYAADSTGLEYRKYWSTSHLPGIRPSHIMSEQDSIARGGLRKDERFANGLMFPGDPMGGAEEIINCRCCLLTEIV